MAAKFKGQCSGNAANVGAHVHASIARLKASPTRAGPGK